MPRRGTSGPLALPASLPYTVPASADITRPLLGEANLRKSRSGVEAWAEQFLADGWRPGEPWIVVEQVWASRRRAERALAATLKALSEGGSDCLHGLHHFVSLAEAQAVVEAWREEYDTERPHRGLGQLPPAEFAALFTPEEGHASRAILRC